MRKTHDRDTQQSGEADGDWARMLCPKRWTCRANICTRNGNHNCFVDAELATYLI